MNGVKIRQASQFDWDRMVDQCIYVVKMHAQFNIWWVLPFNNYVKGAHLDAYEPATVYGRLQRI